MRYSMKKTMPGASIAGVVGCSFLLAMGGVACSSGGREGADGPGPEEGVDVAGAVLMPDSTVAPDATVWTDPPTGVDQTNEQGLFRFEDPVEPGIYTVHAELENLQGSTLYQLDAVAADSGEQAEPLLVVLGTTRVSPRIDLDSLRALPGQGPGRVRPDGT